MRDRLVQLGVNTYKRVARHYTLLPRMVKVETTKTCNLRCPGCRRNYEVTLSKEPGPKHLTVEALARIVETVPIKIVRFEGDGEPLCNPYFGDLVRFCERRGIRSAMTTNATLLTEEYVEFLERSGMVRVHVSFDGTTKETFERARAGAKYEEVLRNCELLGKSRIQLFMSILLSSDGIVKELLDYARLAREVGATGVHVMKLQAENLNFGKSPDPVRYKGLLEEFKEEARRHGLVFVSTINDMPTFIECEDPYVCPYVILGGDVYPCSYMANLRESEVYLDREFLVPSRDYKMGNLYSFGTTLRDIWKGESYRKLRQVLAESRPSKNKLQPEELLELREQTQGKGRFAYCYSCLCRWGESGL
jgi:MoaA/NifB/PqqE/SkfB family radical SAM enzyme